MREGGGNEEGEGEGWRESFLIRNSISLILSTEPHAHWAVYLKERNISLTLVCVALCHRPHFPMAERRVQE